MSLRLEKLKVRRDFVRVAAAGRKAAVGGLVLQAAQHPKGSTCDMKVRVGFTASRRVGNAVTRNRAKRRMRAAAASILPHRGRPGTDYVLIARVTTANRPFASLLMDLTEALRQLGQNRAPRRPDVSSGIVQQTRSSDKAPREAHQPRHQFGPQ